MSVRSVVIQAYMPGKAGMRIGPLPDKLEHMTDENIWRDIALRRREVAALRREVEAAGSHNVIAMREERPQMSWTNCA
jgi:hypothetical protein